MTFEEAAQQYATLRQQRDCGQLADAYYRAAVARLVVADAQGNWWTLDADSAEWVPYAPPAAPPAPPPPMAPPPLPPPPMAPPAAIADALPAQALGKTGRGLPQSTWDLISVIGSAVLSAGWYLYSGMAETKPDYLTCGAMLVLPISFVLFRKPLDGVLRSVQPLRSKIPPMVLAGCCAAVPYLVSNYLYAFGIREFRFMFCSYVLSTLFSFILLRQPSGGAGRAMPPGVSDQEGTI